MATQFDPVARLFIEKVQQALPAAETQDIYWGFHFLLGAMTTTFAETGRIDQLSHGVCRSDDLDTIHARMIPFLAAGFNAICAPAPGRSRGKRKSGH